MPLTITISALKGGVGKSTIATNVASCLSGAGHRVLIVDADSQGTCRQWASKAAEAGREGPAVVSMDGPALRRDLESVGSAFDVVVIDTPPRLGIEARAAMMAADIVIMPVIPGGADVWALHETLGVLEEATCLRPDLRAAIVVNRCDRTSLARATMEALSSVTIKVLRSTLGARVAFGEAMLQGTSVVTLAPASVAAQEITELTKDILAELGDQDGQQDNTASPGVHAAEAETPCQDRARSRTELHRELIDA